MHSILIKTIVFVLLWTSAWTATDVQVNDWEWCSSESQKNTANSVKQLADSLKMLNTKFDSYTSRLDKTDAVLEKLSAQLEKLEAHILELSNSQNATLDIISGIDERTRNCSCTELPETITTVQPHEPHNATEDCCNSSDNVRLVSLESDNYPGRYWRHCNFLGFSDSDRVNPICSAATFKKDSTFRMVQPGLTGEPGTVSFESVNYPGRILRHQGYRIKLHRIDGSDLFNRDATFKQIRGLSVSPGSSDARRFESVNYPGYYIRHCSNNLWIDNNARGNRDCDPNIVVYRQDVTFHLRSGLVKRA